FHLSMSTKFFISFVAWDVIVIGDLFYITPLKHNRQHLFIKNFSRPHETLRAKCSVVCDANSALPNHAKAW
ncbi:hypothetical protein, partial [Bacillus cereus]|uniref:hypothetical protein n=1 Tax=Bacillus cereus TaxID=1396 RepID=UPI001B35089D